MKTMYARQNDSVYVPGCPNVTEIEKANKEKQCDVGVVHRANADDASANPDIISLPREDPVANLTGRNKGFDSAAALQG